MELSESERIEMTPTPNHWEGTDGKHSKVSLRTESGKAPSDGSLQGYFSVMG